MNEVTPTPGAQAPTPSAGAPSHIPAPKGVGKPAAPAAAPPAPVEAPAPAPAAAPKAEPKLEDAADLFGGVEPAPQEKPQEKSKDSTPAEGEKPAEPPSTPQGEEKAPEFKLPEGVKIDQTLMAEALPVFKELGIPHEGQQKMVDLVVKAQTRWATGLASAQDNAWKQADEKWRATIRADADLGGAKLKDTQAALQRAVSFGGEVGAKMVALLRSTGMQNHPDVVRFLRDVGNKIAEDSIAMPRPNNSNEPPSRSQKLKTLYSKSQE